MTTDSWITRSTPAAMAAPTMAAEPSVRTRSLARHTLGRMNWVTGGIADVMLTTASWPSNAAVSADRSKIDTVAGRAP
ncbi:hypothetical protein BH23ACT10_BH23ACT10_22960 [soil metagenome]